MAPAPPAAADANVAYCRAHVLGLAAAAAGRSKPACRSACAAAAGAAGGSRSNICAISAAAGAGYTAVDPESRRIVPTDAEKQGKTVVKMVYVVLEAQYQVRAVMRMEIAPKFCKTEQMGDVDIFAPRCGWLLQPSPHYTGL